MLASSPHFRRTAVFTDRHFITSHLLTGGSWMETAIASKILFYLHHGFHFSYFFLAEISLMEMAQPFQKRALMRPIS
jgi:hypothetical protein